MRWIDQLPEQAINHLPPAVYEYFRRGSAAEHSLNEAATGWDDIRLRPRVLRDMSRVSTATTVLGTPVDTPVLVAPSTLQLQCDPAGEVATATGSAAAGSLICVTSNTGVPFKELTGIAPWWVQAYVLRDRGLTRSMLDVAVKAGARAVVLTADSPVFGRPDPSAVPDVWGTVPPDITRANWQASIEQLEDHASDVTFDDIGWLRDTTDLPVVVKGVLRGDDARNAVAAGAAAIWVSNHGGRQLDGAISTATALGDVAGALGGTDAELYVDGGIRRGTHVLAALALGARAVFLGRPVLWALACHGGDGVRRVLTDITAELANSLALAGARSPAEVTRDLIA